MQRMTPNAAARTAASALAALLAIGCGGDPINPSPPPRPTPLPPISVPPPLLIAFPPPAGPSRTFTFDRELSYPVRDFTRESRIVLYDNGAFELHYLPNQYGPGVFGGAYQDVNGALMFLFEFQGRSVGTLWDDAAGTLEDDSLTIRYEETMQHADFEDAVYMLMR